jgi:uncharacterized damage-inducible protein DinB
MKPTDTLTTLFDHNLWANLLLLERCSALSSEQLNATISGAYGSIRDTLQHIVTGEQLYFSLVSTGQRYDRPEDAPPMTIAEMTEAVRTTGAGLIEWAPQVQADQVDGEGIPKTIILTQAINHATEHRAQIMAILTQLGIQPPDLDGWTYFDTHSQPPNAFEISQYIVDTFPGVETAENFGYTFFFYGADHMRGFATLATADNEGDRVSNLDRPGVFRLNVGVGKETFQSLFAADRGDFSSYDYTALDRFMPHPDYAAQNFICVLNPSRATFERVRTFLAEAYELARVRSARRAKTA